MDRATATKTLNNPSAHVFGIDVGDRVSHVCVLDEQSGEVGAARTATFRSAR